MTARGLRAWSSPSSWSRVLATLRGGEEGRERREGEGEGDGGGGGA